MVSASLTSGIKTALNALSSINSQIDTSNQRLATGKKVNSALDDALNFFTASGLSDRATTLSKLQDNIGLGIKTIQQADKALTSQKNALDNITGQLQQALQSTGTNAKAVGNKSYASGSALVAGAAGNTDRAQFQVGDTFKVSIGTTDAAGTFTSTATQAAAFVFAAGTTVQQFADQINNDAVLNGGLNGQRVRAYINDSGNLAVEQSQSGTAPSGQSFALQLATTNGSGAGTVTNNLREVFGVSGDTNKAVADVITGAAPTETQTVTITSASNASRAAIATNFKELIQNQVTNLAKDAGFNGTNLLNGDTIRVQFNEDNTTSLTTRGVRFDASGLGFRADNATNNTGDTAFGLQSDKEIRDALKVVKAATDQLKAQQGTFANNFNILQNRADYTKNTVKNLNDGADELVEADINEEGARLTSLQTRQQLSVTALSLANRSDQAILRLF